MVATAAAYNSEAHEALRRFVRWLHSVITIRASHPSQRRLATITSYNDLIGARPRPSTGRSLSSLSTVLQSPISQFPKSSRWGRCKARKTAAWSSNDASRYTVCTGLTATAIKITLNDKINCQNNNGWWFVRLHSRFRLHSRCFGFTADYCDLLVTSGLCIGLNWYSLSAGQV